MAPCPAELYDAFYDALGKDYEAEARTVLRLVRSRRPGRRPPASLLDVACGTGRHLAAFGATVRVTGVDLDADMLRVAAGRCPKASLIRADLRTLDLGTRFDAVTCLFGSVAYVRTLSGLRQAVALLARHVSPGGVLVVEPWYPPDTWDEECARHGVLDLIVVDEPARKIVRTCRSSRRGQVGVLDLDVLAADADGTRHFRERHRLGLFTIDQYVAAFEAAGLDTTVDEHGLWGYGLVLGLAP
jgi:SAM-dependent methyltransferase